MEGEELDVQISVTIIDNKPNICGMTDKWLEPLL
jgi:hypothetical protein